jgi:taurine dioxygenase
MKILPSDSAYEVREHPVIRTHPETGRKVLWVNAVYTIGIKGMKEEQSAPLLKRLCRHATEDRFVYRHRWAANMLTVWDNRCVQHCAQGGYDGHLRVMHRTTVAGDRPY